MHQRRNGGFAVSLAISFAMLLGHGHFFGNEARAAADVAVAGPEPGALASVPAGCFADLQKTPFDSFRHVIHCLQAWTEYNPSTCNDISPGNYKTTSAPKHGKITTGIITGGIAACPGKTFPFGIAYYTWTDDKANDPQDPFTIHWFTPDGRFDMTFPMVAVLAPRITGPSTSTVWWFKGEKPAGYQTAPNQTEITLTAAPSGLPSYTWAITAGTTKVKLSASTTDMVKVTGLLGSSAMKDVSITVKANGGTSNPIKLTVKQPKKLGPLAKVDRADPTFAYLSFIHYKILDQFGKILPADVPVNEQWTATCPPPAGNSCPTPDTPNNWRGSQNCGKTLKCPTLSPNDWNDVIGGESAGHMPVPQNPQTPLGTKAINHWNGKWSIGGVNPGDGVRVQTNTWQKYRDHARHTNIVSPAIGLTAPGSLSQLPAPDRKAP